MKEIRLGIKNGLSEDKVALYSNILYSDSEMCEIRNAFEEGLSIVQIKANFKEGLGGFEMYKQRMKLKFLLTENRFENYLDKMENKHQLEEIRCALKNGLSEEQIDIFANNTFDHKQMKVIRNGLEKNLPLKKMKAIADPNIFWREMEKKIGQAINKNKNRNNSRNFGM